MLVQPPWFPVYRVLQRQDAIRVELGEWGNKLFDGNVIDDESLFFGLGKFGREENVEGNDRAAVAR
jgi:hypothetical protein